MAKRTMEQVKIGSFPAGKAYGAFIYNLGINVGTQGGQATTIDVDLINETGDYNITENDLEGVSPVTIRIQSESGDFINIKSCFLVSYSEEKNADSSTLKLKYVDGSSILDKIQILLLNKQANPANFNVLGVNGMPPTPRGGFDPSWYNTYSNPFVSNYTVPVSCINKCANTGRVAWSTVAQVNTLGVKFYPEDPRNPWPQFKLNAAGFPFVSPLTGLPIPEPRAYGHFFNQSRANLNPTVNFRHDKCTLTNVDPANLALGGAIIIGEEEFVSSNCQLPNVVYGFEDLRLILQNYLGINIMGWGNRGRPDLKESFTGSLREVLTSWGNVYGYNYRWDFENDAIVAIDLQAGVAGENILLIKDLIENLQQNTSNPSAALRLNYSTSIEGTYRQDDISTFLRPARKKVIEDKFTKGVLFEPVTIRNIIPYKEAGQPGTNAEEVSNWNLLTGGRTSAELIVSSVLAKFNKNARTLYNYYLIATKTNGFDPELMKQWGGLGRPLGLTLKKLLPQKDKDDLLSYTMNAKTFLANSVKYGKDAGCFLGTYSQEFENSWIKWEQGIADFIGKYYFYSNFISDEEVRSYPMQMCFDRTVETIPQSEIYINGTNPAYFPQGDERHKSMINDLPFKDLLRHPGGATFELVHPDTKVPLQEMRLISRNPNYGFNEEDVEKVFYENAEDLLKEYIPSFSEITAAQGAFINDLIEDAFPNIKGPLEEIKNEAKKPMLFFFPSISKITDAFNIPNGLRGVAGYDWVKLGGNPYTTEIQIKTETNENIAQFWNSREYQPKTKESESNQCELYCDFDLTSFLCDCPDSESGDINVYSPDKVGLTSLGARFFDVNVVGGKTGRFVLPSEYPYRGFFRITDKMQKTEQGIKQNYGFLNNAAGTMGYKVNVRDITSDMETLDNEQGTANSPKVGGNVEQGSEGVGQIKTHVLINKYDENLGTAGQLLEGRDYHALTDSSYTNSLANKQLSFEIVGLDFDALKIDGNVLQPDGTVATEKINIINPSVGLSSLGVSYGEGGLIMNFSYETRPPQPPDLDGVMQKMGTRLNYNSYLRTY
tara:strand:- start:1151 stop:4321 length:3171 start_codon:yes stop_codon:yes gene_type:complete